MMIPLLKRNMKMRLIMKKLIQMKPKRIRNKIKFTNKKSKVMIFGVMELKLKKPRMSQLLKSLSPLLTSLFGMMV
jgi:hypothetical protein